MYTPHGSNALVDEVHVAGAVDEVEQVRLPGGALQHHGHRARFDGQASLLLVDASVGVPYLLRWVERLHPGNAKQREVLSVSGGCQQKLSKYVPRRTITYVGIYLLFLCLFFVYVFGVGEGWNKVKTCRFVLHTK